MDRNKEVIVKCLKIMYPPFLYLVLLALLAKIVSRVWGQETYQGHALLVSIVAMSVMIPFFLLVYLNEKGKMSEFFSKKKKAGILTYLVVIVVAMIASAALNFLIAFVNLHRVFPEYAKVAEKMYQESGYIVLLATLLFAPIMEELIFRGVCFCRIRQLSNPAMTILLTGLLFGIYHANLVQFVYALIMGCLFGVLFEKYRDIRLVIVAHFAANLCAVLLSFSRLQF